MAPMAMLSVQKDRSAKVKPISHIDTAIADSLSLLRFAVVADEHRCGTHFATLAIDTVDYTTHCLCEMESPNLFLPSPPPLAIPRTHFPRPHRLHHPLHRYGTEVRGATRLALTHRSRSSSRPLSHSSLLPTSPHLPPKSHPAHLAAKSIV